MAINCNRIPRACGLLDKNVLVIGSQSHRNSSFLTNYLNGLSSRHCDFAPVLAAQEHVLGFHELLGCHWLTDIIATTFIIRTVVSLPLSIWREKIIVRYGAVKIAMYHYSKQLNEEVIEEQKIGAMNKEIAKRTFFSMVNAEKERLIVKHKCHPLRAIIAGGLDIPIWVLYFLALRNLAVGFPKEELNEVARQQMSTDGALWFTDLTIADPYYILPVAVTMVHLLTHFVSALRLVDVFFLY